MLAERGPAAVTAGRAVAPRRRLGRPAASGQPTTAATAESATSRAIGHPSRAPRSTAPAATTPVMGSAMASAQNTGPRSSCTTRPPATAASSPNATQSRAGPPRPWPVIDIQTEGPPGRDHRVGVDARAARGPEAATPRSPRRPAPAAARAPARPSAVDRSSATDRLPALSRSKNAARPAAGAVGTGGRLDLHDRGARPPGAASRTAVRPTATPARHDRARQRGRGPGRRRNERRSTGGRGAVRRSASPSTGGRQAEERARVDHLAPTDVALSRRADRLPRIFGRPVELEPCGHQRHIVGPRQRHRHPPVAGGEEAGGAPHAGGPTPVEPRDGGALAEQRQRIDLELAAQRRRRPPHLRARAPQAGHQAAPADRAVTVEPPGERHGTARRPGGHLDVGVQRGRRVGERVHGATMIARHPAVRLPMASPPRLPRRPGRRRPLRRRAAVAGLATGAGRRRPRHPGGRRADAAVVVAGRGRGRRSEPGRRRRPPDVRRRGGGDGDDLGAIEATVGAHPLASSALTTPAARGRRSVAPRGCCSSPRCTPRSRPARSSRRGERPPGEGALAAGERVRVERGRRALHITLTRPEVRNALDTPCAISSSRPSSSLASTTRSPRSTCGATDRRSAPVEISTSSGPGPIPRLRTSCGSCRAPGGRSRRWPSCHGPRPRCVPGLRRGAAGVRGTVVASSDATFGLPEVQLGLIPGAGGTVILPRRIGRHRTAWLALTGRSIDAPTARAWGLVDDVRG